MEIPQVTLRPAREEDAKVIRDLVHKVQINPMGLDWRRFTLAVNDAGQILACGQLKPHANDLLELASIAVEPAYQGQGLGSQIITRLIAIHRMQTAGSPTPLYLTCRFSLGSYYARFGFREASQDEMPKYFRRIQRLANLFLSASKSGQHLLVMVLDSHN